MEERLSKTRMEKFEFVSRGQVLIFFPNLYKLKNSYILMDFYLVFLWGVCLRSARLDGSSVKYP
jgi:hypothetical protein